MPGDVHITTRADAGRTLAAVVRQHWQLSWTKARRCIAAGRVQLNGKVCTQVDLVLHKGQQLLLDAPKNTATWPADVPRPQLVFQDEHLLVVNKPAGLTTVRHAEERREHGARARFLPPTLADLLPRLLGSKERVRAVHRLDKETSGLLVFARTAEAERLLGKQLRERKLERRYLALVRGQAVAERIESTLVRDRGDGRRGSGPDGEHAVTHVGIREQLGAYALVECVLETGRTHQVRIHLGERGTPLCGESVYDRPLHGKPFPDDSGAKRPMLHAAALAFDHPITGKRLSWEAPLPHDMAQLLKRLRRTARSCDG